MSSGVANLRTGGEAMRRHRERQREKETQAREKRAEEEARAAAHEAEQMREERERVDDAFRKPLLLIATSRKQRSEGWSFLDRGAHAAARRLGSAIAPRTFPSAPRAAASTSDRS